MSAFVGTPALPAAKAPEDADPANQSWLERAVAGPGSTLALAFICNKALMPVRLPITVALTPAVARCGVLWCARGIQGLLQLGWRYRRACAGCRLWVALGLELSPACAASSQDPACESQACLMT